MRHITKLHKMSKIERLTPGEEEIMQLIWELEPVLVSQILDIIEVKTKERPPHSTVSSIVRILENKGFVSHKAYGRTYEYFSIIKKKDYSKRNLLDLLGGYFEGSANNLVSFLVRENAMDKEDLKELIENIENSEK